jgi:methyl-accepting chemotaxis protein
VSALSITSPEREPACNNVRVSGHLQDLPVLPKSRQTGDELDVHRTRPLDRVVAHAATTPEGRNMKALRNMKISARLALSSAVSLLLMLGTVVASIRAQDALDAMDKEALHAQQRARLIMQVDRDSAVIQGELANMFVAPDSSQRESQAETIRTHSEHRRETMEQLKAKGGSVQQLAQLAALDEAITRLQETSKSVVRSLMRDNRPEGLALFQPGCRRKLEELAKIVNTLDAEYLKDANVTEERADVFVGANRWLFVGIGALAILVTAFLSRSTARSVSVPIGRTVATLSELSAGDLTRSMAADLLGRKDEIGLLAQAVQALADNLRGTVSDVSGGAMTLAMAATEMANTAKSLLSGSQNVTVLATTVASAAEESSANTTSVAAAMEQATSNLSTVAAATEEMSATVGEIAANAEKARAISSDATGQAQAVSAMMNELGRAANDIGKVTETITGISAQTNLLALNATIEAARAGAAGKGFAVVANEIKELAQQTAVATEDIKSKIAGIQASTGSTIGDIAKITHVIQQVGDIVASIAAAIEEQSTVTRDVAGNIAQASAGVRDASARVATTASASQHIAKDIAEVTSTMTEIVASSKNLSGSTTDLSELAQILTDRVGKFQV